jgi:hypothetical protein
LANNLRVARADFAVDEVIYYINGSGYGFYYKGLVSNASTTDPETNTTDRLKMNGLQVNQMFTFKPSSDQLTPS